MSVPQDSSKSHQTSNNKEQKVIVLSMKNMPSFKFDVTKSLLATNHDNGQSVFSFKPQQLIQSPPHSIQIPQAKTSATNIQVVSQPSNPVPQKIQGTSQTILIRAQSPTSLPKSQIPVKPQPQQISLINHSNIFQSSGMRKMPTEITLKNQAGQPFIVQSATGQRQIIVPSQNSGQNQTKIYQIPCSPKSAAPKQPMKIIQSSLKESPKPIPILPKPDAQQKVQIVQQQLILPSSAVIVQQTANQQIKSNVITIPVTGSSYVKYNAQKQQTKWPISAVSNIFPPALTPIQPKVSITPTAQPKEVSQEKNEKVNILMEIDETECSSESSDIYEDEEDLDENMKEEQLEKTPEKPNHSAVDEAQQYLDVKRIIEGDDGLITYPEKSSELDHELFNAENESTEIEENGKQSKNITTTNNTTTSQSITTQQHLLLCDEQIASVTPEESPENSDKSKDQVTPMHNTNEMTIKSQSVEEVKKNLKLDDINSSSTTAHDNSSESENNNKKMMEIDENESIMSDDQSNQSSMIEQKNKSADNDDDSYLKTEMDEASTSKSQQVAGSSNKGKRNRKPKNPTVITSLGLPYKPPQPSSRKKKVEKKIELEMDFHDPINKILWQDGIGGLNNCNKLFGFNEFGLIEVLNKKDATAKLKMDEKPAAVDDNCNFKFRKIVDPGDQFVCIICSKLGTVRDFYSPECCSESCFAITKRKTSEFNSSANENNDSGISTLVESKKVIYGGETITLQQLQQILLEQNLPEAKRKHKLQKKISIGSSEVKFSWETYLTPKSVPAPENLFIYTSKTATTHFRVGMKLEAIDPKNQHLFCVCTVEEKLGCRMKLHFDGFPSSYDYWANSDSLNIFPVGFCQSTGRKLNVPPRWNNKKFDWTEYFDYTNSVGAQKYMFSHLTKQLDETNPFTVGMKLEVKHEDFWYAATIIDVINLRVLIRFDGIYENFGCYWFDIDSPYLSPCNAHKLLDDQNVFKPPYNTGKPFDWAEYIKSCEAEEAPKDLSLKTRKPYQFEPGMKLEVVDKVNPQLIRPSTILCRNEYKIQVIFDGFDLKYAYWLDDDSEDIHPINYCKQTEHPIEHPAGANKALNSLCSINGCRGIGNGIHSNLYFHDNPKECPYNIDNWNRLIEQNENTRLEYKPYVKRNKNSTFGAESSDRNRSLLVQNVAVKYKKEKTEEVEIKEESVTIAEDTSNDAPKVVKKRGKKRKIVQEIIEEQQQPENDISEDVDRNAKIHIMKHFLEDYGPQLNYAYNLWTKNSKILNQAAITDDDLSENPLKWNVDDVCTFLVKFCDEETTAKFYAQKIDGEALLGLCQKDLVTLMNIKVGPAVKIYNRILWLRQEVMTKFAEF